MSISYIFQDTVCSRKPNNARLGLQRHVRDCGGGTLAFGILHSRGQGGLRPMSLLALLFSSVSTFYVLHGDILSDSV